jgi:hypothetical protein
MIATLRILTKAGTAMRTALFVSFLMGVSALPAQDSELGVTVDTTLSQVRADAEAYKSVQVKFTIQFASLGKIYNPFFTKFTPSEYSNFYAWPDEQPIWRLKDYHDVFGMLFLSKSSDKLDQLYKLKAYQRVAVTGIVRNTFQSLPWIEVTDSTCSRDSSRTPVLTQPVSRREVHGATCLAACGCRAAARARCRRDRTRRCAPCAVTSAPASLRLGEASTRSRIRPPRPTWVGPVDAGSRTCSPSRRAARRPVSTAPWIRATCATTSARCGKRSTATRLAGPSPSRCAERSGSQGYRESAAENRPAAGALCRSPAP